MELESFLIETILPELEKGRPGWDKPHTEAVVKNLKLILDHTNHKIDEEVLLIAAYAHDWGYAGLFKNKVSINLDQVLGQKDAHMQIGAEKLEQLLKNSVFDNLSAERKARAVHLVRVHDKLKEINDLDERILVEADTLGGLDIDQSHSTFDAKSKRGYIQGVIRKRLPLFVNDYSLRRAEELIRQQQSFL